MSVTFAKGFTASGVKAKIKSSDKHDVALVVNEGPLFASAAVFTSNKFKAAPVLWSQEIMKTGQIKAVILNSGGANACTGPDGFADTHQTAEHVAKILNVAPINVAVCSTGLIGERLPMDKLLTGCDLAKAALSNTGGSDAALAIMTTDSVPKVSELEVNGFRIGGMAKGAGMLAPGLATMLVCITTDAVVDPIDLDNALKAAVNVSFNRIDSDGCMSTNDTVLLLANGASGIKPDVLQFNQALEKVCKDLARQLIADAEGSTKDINIKVVNANTEQDALEVARAVGRSNLLKCAIHGQDPNWGRVLAAAGTTNAKFEADNVDVSLNGVWVCRNGMTGDDRNLVSMQDRVVEIEINLNSGASEVELWTNDLTAMYVHENSAYSS
ncbi:MAG: bifunctional glutamate N-acetyltransferase/amino-acid acetyltransferase ArgJ [Actinobacteria bacterium]|nr:bifunctional glutamate N-acetyltransferase/amino-acid acetyltransferase ArgJ [Actinomycetota bacterium]